MNLQLLLDKWKIKISADTILDIWNESHRHYHNLTHLNSLLDKIEERFKSGEFDEKMKEKLIITALFHDIVYEPGRDNNEEKSAEFLMEASQDKSDPDILEIKNAILETKDHKSSTKLSEVFNHMDMSIVEEGFEELLEWEKGIYQEFKQFGDKYKPGRLKFLESLLDKYPTNSGNLVKLIEWVKENY
jgi:pantetheine-phosphate adenylyltransferase